MFLTCKYIIMNDIFVGSVVYLTIYLKVLIEWSSVVSISKWLSRSDKHAILALSEQNRTEQNRFYFT